MALLGAMSHVGITVSDLDDAMQFFKPFLEFLGYEFGMRSRMRMGSA
jgi:catechol-2,3-dioxygenase